MCYSQIWQNIRGDEYLCKLGKEYLNASLCKFVVNLLQHSETFDVSHDFLPLTIAELLTLKQVRFFLAHPVFTYNTKHSKQICMLLVNKLCKNIKNTGKKILKKRIM